MKTSKTDIKLARLQTKLAALNAQINRIDWAKSARANRKLKGKCFRVENSYGSSQPGKWMKYVTYVKAGVTLEVFAFELTSDNKFNVYPAKHGYPPHDDYIEIPKHEFMRAWSCFVTKMNEAFPYGKLDLQHGCLPKYVT